MPSRIPACLALLLLALAGCSESDNPITTFAPAPPVPFRGDAHWFDGSYQGREKLVRATIPNCPPTQYGVIEIGDATLQFAYAPDLTFTVPVAADGTLASAESLATLRGRIVGRHLELTITTASCQTQFRMEMVWNRA